MTNVLEFATLGAATGALYAVVALGVVIVYRASGVLNFASGATGAAGAYVFYDLRDAHGVWWIAALGLGLLTGALMGVVTYLLVIRFLKRTSRLARMVATLGIMSAVQGGVVLLFGANFSNVRGVLPTEQVNLTRSFAIGADRLILIAVVVVAASGLWYVYKSTTFGLATSAVAENRRAAAALGTSTATVEVVNFVIAGTLSAAAAIFLAPIAGLDAGVLTLLIIPALAAALLGGFSSFGLAVVGAMVIGILESEIVRYVTSPGWVSVVPFIMIIVVVVGGGQARPARGDLLSRLPMPGSGRLSPFAIAAAGSVTVAGLFLLSNAWVDAVLSTVLLAVIALSVVVVTGYAGQLSLCQFALAGFGAWVAGRLVAAAGLPFWLAAILAVVITIPAGLLVALPSLRTRGVNLAIVTLGFSVAVEGLIFNNINLTGGSQGTIVGSPHLFGIDLDPVGHPARYAVLAVVLLAAMGILVANVRRGRAGRRLLAVRSNERAAGSVGIGVYGAKLYAFGLAAGIAAVGGVLIAFENTIVVLTNFTSLNSITTIQTSVIGGIGWTSGGVLAGMFGDGGILNYATTSLVSALHSWIRWIPAVSAGTVGEWLPVLAGLSVVATLCKTPDGIASLAAAQVRRRFPRRTPQFGTTTSTEDTRPSRPPTTMVVEGLSVRFGGVQALDNVSLSLRSGEVLGVIGPNGAGKTTLLDAITGFVRPTHGTISINDEKIDTWKPERRARAGIVRSFQAVELFDEMTVRENLLVAADHQAPLRYLTDLIRPGVQLPSSRMLKTIHDFGIEELLDKYPPELSHGNARLVGIARAMVTEPAVLLLDEPAAGLDIQERIELRQFIANLAAEHGVAVVVIEHDVPLVLETCDRVLVLLFGRVIAEGTPEEIRKNPAVIAAYLGEPETDVDQLATGISIESYP